ncbi:MAG: CPBP family intramembrane metalloprotease [Caldilinea sp. CFX5]|nr:CPBP family intramembrane metalloprotease [Caldilinea sp. CFX5]
MEAVNRLFWNRSERRWRAGWRVVLYSLLWVTIQLASSQVIESPLTTALIALLPPFAPIAGELLFYTINALLVIGLTWLLVRYFDHRSLADLGLAVDRHWIEDFCFGLLLGAGLVTLIFIAEWSLGWLTVAGYLQTTLPDTPLSVAIWQPIFLFIAIAINEELLARGYQLRNLAEGFNYPLLRAKGAIVLAWVISSLFFGFLHIFNPNSTWLSTLALMLVGLFLGLGYVLTGRLGLPIGLHITWNFFLGSVYGFRVSGNNLSSITLIAIQQTGPQLWTGGAFGPEAGLFGLVAILLGLLFTALWVQWRYGAVTLQWALARYCDIRQPISSHQQGAYDVK